MRKDILELGFKSAHRPAMAMIQQVQQEPSHEMARSISTLTQNFRVRPFEGSFEKHQKVRKGTLLVSESKVKRFNVAIVDSASWVTAAVDC